LLQATVGNVGDTFLRHSVIY